MHRRCLFVASLLLAASPVRAAERAAPVVAYQEAYNILEAPIGSAPAVGAAPEAVVPRVPGDVGILLAKTATYEVSTSLLETGMLVAFFGSGGGAAAGGAFLAVLATTSVVYLVHEFAWEAATPAGTQRDDGELVAKKSVTYRVADTLRAFTIGAVLGGAQMAASAVYVATLTVAELGLYAANEVGFARLRRSFQAQPQPQV